MTELLLCSDLDRTLLPNGEQPESPQARALFARLVKHPALRLAYVSGRHLELVEEAIRIYDLPWPDFAICDVGASIYLAGQQGWKPCKEWQECLDADWRGLDSRQLAAAFNLLVELRPQEESKQSRFKLSYYAAADLSPEDLLVKIDARIANLGIEARVVWSVDETRPIALIDILPRSAGKLAALEFLLQRLGLSEQQAVFAGDSGNDLDVLTSHIPAVLVANARMDVRQQALCRAGQFGGATTLYLAKGGYRKTNGNYASGIVEGVLHFFPQFDGWLEPEK